MIPMRAWVNLLWSAIVAVAFVWFPIPILTILIELLNGIVLQLQQGNMAVISAFLAPNTTELSIFLALILQLLFGGVCLWLLGKAAVNTMMVALYCCFVPLLAPALLLEKFQGLFWGLFERIVNLLVWKVFLMVGLILVIAALTTMGDPAATVDPGAMLSARFLAFITMFTLATIDQKLGVGNVSGSLGIATVIKAQVVGSGMRSMRGLMGTGARARQAAKPPAKPPEGARGRGNGGTPAAAAGAARPGAGQAAASSSPTRSTSAAATTRPAAGASVAPSVPTRPAAGRPAAGAGAASGPAAGRPAAGAGAASGPAAGRPAAGAAVASGPAAGRPAAGAGAASGPAAGRPAAGAGAASGPAGRPAAGAGVAPIAATPRSTSVATSGVQRGMASAAPTPGQPGGSRRRMGKTQSNSSRLRMTRQPGPASTSQRAVRMLQSAAQPGMGSRSRRPNRHASHHVMSQAQGTPPALAAPATAPATTTTARRAASSAPSGSRLRPQGVVRRTAAPRTAERRHKDGSRPRSSRGTRAQQIDQALPNQPAQSTSPAAPAENSADLTAGETVKLTTAALRAVCPTWVPHRSKCPAYRRQWCGVTAAGSAVRRYWAHAHVRSPHTYGYRSPSAARILRNWPGSASTAKWQPS